MDKGITHYLAILDQDETPFRKEAEFLLKDLRPLRQVWVDRIGYRLDGV
jgi:hypothetical protein